MTNNRNTHRLTFEDKEITLIGTAHVSKESADLVGQVITEEKPETVCIELCQSRYQSLTQRDQWQNTDLVKVIKEKKAFLLLSNLMLAYFQKKIGQKLGNFLSRYMKRRIYIVHRFFVAKLLDELTDVGLPKLSTQTFKVVP